MEDRLQFLPAQLFNNLDPTGPTDIPSGEASQSADRQTFLPSTLITERGDVRALGGFGSTIDGEVPPRSGTPFPLHVTADTHIFLQTIFGNMKKLAGFPRRCSLTAF